MIRTKIQLNLKLAAGGGRKMSWQHSVHLRDSALSPPPHPTWPVQGQRTSYLCRVLFARALVLGLCFFVSMKRSNLTPQPTIPRSSLLRWSPRPCHTRNSATGLGKLIGTILESIEEWGVNALSNRIRINIQLNYKLRRRRRTEDVVAALSPSARVCMVSSPSPYITSTKVRVRLTPSTHCVIGFEYKFNWIWSCGGGGGGGRKTF